MQGPIIRAPQSEQELEALRALCWEYRDFLLGLGGENAKAVLSAYPVEKYTRVVNNITEEHAAPGGGMRIVLLDGEIVGCGMFHALEPTTAEIKRVYIQPRAQGYGAGRALMEDLVQACRAVGHTRILMDTGKVLETAVALYLSMGFVPRGAYHDVPPDIEKNLRFFEMDLTSG